MIPDKSAIVQHHDKYSNLHQKKFEPQAAILREEGHQVEHIFKKIGGFQVAVPSWAFNK